MDNIYETQHHLTTRSVVSLCSCKLFHSAMFILLLLSITQICSRQLSCNDIGLCLPLCWIFISAIVVNNRMFSTELSVMSRSAETRQHAGTVTCRPQTHAVIRFHFTVSNNHEYSSPVTAWCLLSLSLNNLQATLV